MGAVPSLPVVTTTPRLQEQCVQHTTRHQACIPASQPQLTGAAGLSSAVSGRFAATRWKPLSSWLLVTSMLSDSLQHSGESRQASSKGFAVNH